MPKTVRRITRRKKGTIHKTRRRALRGKTPFLRKRKTVSRRRITLRQRGGAEGIPAAPAAAPAPSSPPTFHCLITSGGRPHLKKMLDSLKPEFAKGDAVTVVFDGPEAKTASGYVDEWKAGFADGVTVTVITEAEKVGQWGHPLRNKYLGILSPRTTFVIQGDDDDEYVPGFASKLRESCVDPNKFYIAKMQQMFGSKEVIPRQDKEIRHADIGTPCGIVPFDEAGKSSWTMDYKGDYNYYKSIADRVGPARIEFLPHIIYNVFRRENDMIKNRVNTVPSANQANKEGTAQSKPVEAAKSGDSLPPPPYTGVIVEPRKTPALPYVLKNFLENMGTEWNVQIFHSTSNEAWLKGLIEKDFSSYKARIQLTSLEKPSMTRDDYSNMLKTVEFYEKIPTEVFLIFQTDSLICGPHKDLWKKFMKYEYVGAPWTDGKVGNGGFSLRKKSKIIEFIKKNGANDKVEDNYFARPHGSMTLYMPTHEEAKEFSVETVYHDKSFGIHKPWGYLQGDMDKIEAQCPGVRELERLYNEPAMP